MIGPVLPRNPSKPLCTRWPDTRHDRLSALPNLPSLVQVTNWTRCDKELGLHRVSQYGFIGISRHISYGSLSFTRPVSSTISKDEPLFSRSGRTAKQRPSGLSLLDGKRIASILLTA